MKFELGIIGKIYAAFICLAGFIVSVWQWEAVTTALQNDWEYAFAFPQILWFPKCYWFWHATWMTLASICFLIVLFMLINEIIRE